jgi:hypothetical protein
MRYQNQNNSLQELLLNSEVGDGGSVVVKGQEYVEGSSAYSIYSDVGLVRVASGVSYGASSAADPSVFATAKQMVINGVTATAADASFYASVTAGVSYTVFGVVSYLDTSVARTCDFSVVGNGTHGSGATFVVETVAGCITQPKAAGSSVDYRTGTISLAFTSGAPDETATSNLVFDFVPISKSINFGRTMDSIFNAPATSEVFAYIASDEDNVPDYVNGSAGQVKTVKTFAAGAQVGDTCRIVSYKYKDTNNPTKPTHTQTTFGTVVLGDLF